MKYLQIFKNWKFHMAQFKAKKSSSPFKHPSKNNKGKLQNHVGINLQRKEIEEGRDKKNWQIIQEYYV